jgi:hypothetical protein
MAKGINQSSPQGEMEPRDLARGGGVNSTPLGNKVSLTAGVGVGVGYNVHRSGGQHGLTNPAPARSEGELFPGFPGRR